MIENSGNCTCLNDCCDLDYNIFKDTNLKTPIICPHCFSDPYVILQYHEVPRSLVQIVGVLCSNPNCPGYEITRQDSMSLNLLDLVYVNPTKDTEITLNMDDNLYPLRISHFIYSTLKINGAGKRILSKLLGRILTRFNIDHSEIRT